MNIAVEEEKSHSMSYHDMEALGCRIEILFKRSFVKSPPMGNG